MLFGNLVCLFVSGCRFFDWLVLCNVERQSHVRCDAEAIRVPGALAAEKEGGQAEDEASTPSRRNVG